MNPLEPPDTHYLAAAEGWLELGNPVEAGAELDRMRSSSQEHPLALQLRWRIRSATKQWEECVRIATRLIELVPEEPFGWVHRSFSLHELKRTAEAHAALAPMASKFPNDFVIPYNMACYACQLGKLDEARRWLKQAIAIAGSDTIRQMAKDDPDLRPLAPEI
jgi:tetratricopeptide (TPR) repeat protein